MITPPEPHVTPPRESLVVRAQNGDPRALDALVRQHRERAWKTAAAITGNRHLTEDAVQEAFARMSRALGSFNGQASFATWLTRIVINCAIDIRRADEHNANPPLEAAASEWTDFDIPDPAVGQSIAGLSPERRVIVVLHYWLDLSTPEIAAALEIPLGTVNSRLSRALEQLRKVLGETDARPA